MQYKARQTGSQSLGIRRLEHLSRLTTKHPDSRAPIHGGTRPQRRSIPRARCRRSPLYPPARCWLAVGLRIPYRSLSCVINFLSSSASRRSAEISSLDMNSRRAQRSASPSPACAIRKYSVQASAASARERRSFPS